MLLGGAPHVRSIEHRGELSHQSEPRAPAARQTQQAKPSFAEDRSID